jgi:hypothetical protein
MAKYWVGVMGLTIALASCAAETSGDGDPSSDGTSSPQVDVAVEELTQSFRNSCVQPWSQNLGNNHWRAGAWCCYIRGNGYCPRANNYDGYCSTDLSNCNGTIRCGCQ